MKVSNFTVGELKEILEKYDDNLEVVISDLDQQSLDIESVSLKSYTPGYLVADNHVDGDLLCLSIKTAVFELV